MKIDINCIPLEGLTLEEKVNPSALDLETDSVKFPGPIKLRAEVSRITNAVTVNLSLSGSILLNCSRCLKEFNVALKKNTRLNYQVDKSGPIIDTSTSLECHGERPSTTLRIALSERSEPNGRSRTIDLDQDIREEIILDYPIKPLCNPDCKGLCPKCGKNLNPERVDPLIHLKEGSNEGGCSCAIT